MTQNELTSARTRSTFGALVVAALVSTYPGLAVAEPTDTAERSKTLFEQGRELMAAGEYGLACPKLEESVRLKPGLGARFNLADCWEHVGRNSSAQTLFLAVARDAGNAGQEDRQVVAEQRASGLKGKVSRLVLQVEAPADGLELRRDDQLVDKATWNEPSGTDPGTFALNARAPGKKPWSGKVVVPASPPGLLVAVQIPALEREPEPPVAKTTAAAASAQQEPPPKAAAPPPREKEESGSSARTVAFVVGGAGLGSLFVAGIAALEYRSKNNEAEAICPLGVACAPGDVAAHDQAVEQARTARSIAYVGAGVGAAAVLGAVALYALGAPSDKRTSFSVEPLVALDGSFGAQLGRRF